MTPASVAQLNNIFWLYSLFSVGGIFTLLFFSSAERDLSRGWRLWGIHNFNWERKVHFPFPAKNSYAFGLNVCSSLLPCFPIFAKSHKHQFSKTRWLGTVVRHRLQAGHVISCFPFWGFQDVAVKVNEKNFSDSGEILIRAIFSPHFLYGAATSITGSFTQRFEVVYRLNYIHLNPGWIFTTCH